MYGILVFVIALQEVKKKVVVSCSSLHRWHTSAVLLPSVLELESWYLLTNSCTLVVALLMVRKVVDVCPEWMELLDGTVLEVQHLHGGCVFGFGLQSLSPLTVYSLLDHLFPSTFFRQVHEHLICVWYM